MPRKVIRFDRGSKRQLEQVRWTVTELFSLSLLAIFLLAAMTLAVCWEMQHQHRYSEPSEIPQIRDAQPQSP